MFELLENLFNRKLEKHLDEEIIMIDKISDFGAHEHIKISSEWSSNSVTCVCSFKFYANQSSGDKINEDQSNIKQLEKLGFIKKPTFDQSGFVVKPDYDNPEIELTMVNDTYLVKIYKYQRHLSYSAFYCKNIGESDIFNKYIRKLDTYNRELKLNKQNFENDFFLGIRFGSHCDKDTGSINYKIPIDYCIENISNGTYYCDFGNGNKISSIIGTIQLDSYEAMLISKDSLSSFLLSNDFAFVGEEDWTPDTTCFYFINKKIKIASKIMLLKKYEEVCIYAHHKDYSYEYEKISNKIIKYK